ncbi:putative Transcription repressor NadR [Candidatus Hydrogenisulfobacillus filiaventi]|uniref:Putative Transcription repressor NadR n=1 Tax=Candidatus Hydrogenisulfobacillus filiaventi TaxID=2707344 RepID=A0A6F8ZG02_9FIRM|nr:transcription repressor NadR [Bacillota bacterium]CAB1128864.1 putative Transcription repressor NadR [Candidatus Hydrogenisulfobacillus filiaventi]
MDGAQRRQAIVAALRAEGSLTGRELADRFQVSRQVIVQDIALLRAEGAPLLSTPRGYAWWEPPKGVIRAVLPVVHGPEPETVRRELSALVDAGVTVVDVVVQHPLYGDLSGVLNLRTPADVDLFMARLAEGRATLLSSLTGGLHLHTVEGSPQAIAAARTALDRLGILLRETEIRRP